MNFELLGYILSILGLIYSVFCIIITYITYKELTFRQRILAEINLNKEVFILVVAIAYIATYHLS